jgi:AcrR family transcriptional regulator
LSDAAPDPAGGSSRRERRKRELHDRIMEAATSLFEAKGFSATTVEEIADAADVAEKTFYNHFATKQNLVQELAEDSLRRMRSMLEEAREHPGSIAEQLDRFFRSAADEAANSSRDLTRELILELVRVSQVDGVGPERNRHLHACFGALLRDAMERGELASDFDVDFFAEICVASYTGIIINWVSLPTYPLRARLLATSRFLAQAIAASPPLDAPSQSPETTQETQAR